jgi:hypothetical protein
LNETSNLILIASCNNSQGRTTEATGGIPCYFSKNSLFAGNLAGAFGMEDFDAFRTRLAAGRPGARDARLAANCLQMQPSEDAGVMT